MITESLVPRKPKYIPLQGITPDQQKTNRLRLDMALEWELIPAKNPFDLSFNEFLRLSPDETKEMLSKAHELGEALIQDAWNCGYRQVILCQNKIVFKTKEDEPIPSGTVEKLSKKHNKACYVFSAPDIVEESNWTPISGEDAYPTIKIFVGSEDVADKWLVENASPILADLDTGNPHYKIFDAGLFSQEMQSLGPFELREGTHLGDNYYYFNKRVKICVQDVGGNIKSTICLIRMVRDWSRCAVVQISPKRTAYVGRDLLRALRIRLKIDALSSTSQILDVS